MSFNDSNLSVCTLPTSTVYPSSLIGLHAVHALYLTAPLSVPAEPLSQ